MTASTPSRGCGVTVIVPTRNEPNLTPFLLRLHEVMEGGEPYEVLVVGGDREALHVPYDALPHQYSLHTYGDSLERSILNGFSHARGDKIVVMDSDGSHPPEKVPELVRALNSSDMAVGSRFVDGSSFRGSPERRLVTWGTGALARLAGSKLSDPMTGFFAVRREVIEGISFKPIPWKVGLEIELKAKPSLAEIPIRFEERGAGRSKTSVKVGLAVVFALLGLIWRRLR